MDGLRKHIRLLFFTALSMSVGLPLGILAIVFGAIKWIVPLFACGIAFVAVGLIVTPFAWIRYVERRHDRKILRLIEREGVDTIADLSRRTGWSEWHVRGRVRRMMFLHLLEGYLLPNDRIAIDPRRSAVARTRRCDRCGANMRHNSIKFICDYCHNTADE